MTKNTTSRRLARPYGDGLERSDFHCCYENTHGAVFWAGEVVTDYFTHQTMVELRGPFPGLMAAHCFMDDLDSYKCDSCKQDVHQHEDHGGCRVPLDGFFESFTKIEEV